MSEQQTATSNKRKLQLKEFEQKFEKNITKIFKRKPKTAKKKEENYESIEQVKVFSLASKTHTGKSSQVQLKRRQATYWLLCTWIGILVGICAYLSHEGLVGIQGFRIWLARLFMQWVSGPGGVFLGWAVYTLSSLAVVMIGGCLCIFVQPMARGGGIAETKAFLNGVNIPGLFQLRTLFIKLISVICAVGGGLCVGQEGPMIHIGAMVAWNMSQMKFSSIPRISYLFRKFQNDKDKRDFVTSGASMGVSAAFSAPIGGTLFGLEEASSFWSHALIWRSFWGCMVATFTASFLVRGSKSGLAGLIQQPTSVMYAVPIGHGYRLYEIAPFILLAIIGGILGGVFIKLNVAINKWRKQKYYGSNRNKVIELAVLAVVTASCSILLPMAFHCQSNSLATAPANMTTPVESTAAAVDEMSFEIYDCKSGEYNPLASLWFTSAEMTLKHLFVREAPYALGYGPLIVFSLLYYILACFTAGTWIAAGLLVPMLIMGASFGRLFGVILNDMFPAAGLDPGIYSLLGATAFMGGVTRMTISLVVIILEITHDMEALLPIMLVAVVAKWTGDMFGHSLYDEQLHIGNVPFLEWDPPRIAHVMVCKEAMDTEYPQLEEDDTVENIYKVISEENIGNVPIVQRGSDGYKLKGSIPKLHLKILLANRAFEHEGLVDVNSVRKFREEPRWDFTEEEMKKVIDLRPYTNLATFSIQETFPLSIAYKIFRAQGLRHLFVVNQRNVLVGVIMRDHLLLHDTKFSAHGKHGGHGANMASHASEQDLLHHEHIELDTTVDNGEQPQQHVDNSTDDISVHVQLDEDEEEHLA